MKALSIEEIKQIEKIPLNFLTGKERSGTTLLQIMLNLHPNIVAPPESRFIMLLYSRYGHLKRWSEQDIRAFYADLLKEGKFKNFWIIDKESLLASLLAAKDIATYPLLCKIVYYHASQNKTEGLATPIKDIKMFFDKNPIYCYYMPLLKKLFPDAKYIHLVRDYRANIVSHRRVFVVKNSADISYRWLKMNMQIEKAKKQEPERYLTLKYEDLVRDTPKSMKQICEFFNISFYDNPAVEHSQGIYSTYNNYNNKIFRKLHEKLFQPLTSEFIYEWKTKLTGEDIFEAESIAGEYGQKMYGYPMFHINGKAPKKPAGGILMKLKYRAIKKIYKLTLENPNLYYLVMHYWKNY